MINWIKSFFSKKPQACNDNRMYQDVRQDEVQREIERYKKNLKYISKYYGYWDKD